VYINEYLPDSSEVYTTPLGQKENRMATKSIKRRGWTQPIKAGEDAWRGHMLLKDKRDELMRSSC
jgi:hypothetical protein